MYQELRRHKTIKYDDTRHVSKRKRSRDLVKMVPLPGLALIAEKVSPKHPIFFCSCLGVFVVKSSGYSMLTYWKVLPTKTMDLFDQMTAP